MIGLQILQVTSDSTILLKVTTGIFAKFLVFTFSIVSWIVVC